VSNDVLFTIFGIVLVAAAAAFVLLPFAHGAHVEPLVAADNPETDRFALYTQVLELEFDHQLGKISTADFEQVRAELLAQAGAALREERGSVGAVDAQIEREIAAARAAFAAARATSRGQAERVS
jgi:cytochrome c-type biogenesis protein CcmI